MRQMKDSGIAWIGQIPQEWEVRRIGVISNVVTGQTLPKNDKVEYYGESGLMWVKPDNLAMLKPIYKTVEYINDFGKNIVVRVEPLTPLVCCIGTIGKVGYSEHEVTFNQQINAICFKNIVNRRYGLYSVMSQEKQHWYYANGNVIKILNATCQKKIVLPLPPLSEQQAIADKLDKVCGEIDNVIAKTKAVVEEYKKLKQAIITEAVTGKRQCVMRNSQCGIKEKWAEIKLKWVATLNGRIGWQGLTSIEYCDEGAYLITGINFENGGVNWNTCVHVPLERWEEAKDIQISEGDLIITKDGTVGKTAIVRNMPGKTSLNSGVLLISTNDNCKKEYLYWVLNSDIFWKWFNDINSGNSTIIHLYQHDFKEFSFPLHPLPEQQAIVAYLDSKCGAIDEVIAKKQQLITEMENYKKSVIYEYVTGKKEVG